MVMKVDVSKSKQFSRTLPGGFSRGGQLKSIDDRRPEAVAQAKMIAGMGGSQGNGVVQCRLWLKGGLCDGWRDAARVMANDNRVGWDDQWSRAVQYLIDADVDWEFRTPKELEEVLEKMVHGYFNAVKYQQLPGPFPSWMRVQPSKSEYERRSGENMNKRGEMPVIDVGGGISLYHGTSLKAAQAIQASGFLTPANPVYRGYLDASTDGFLSFSPSNTDSYKVTFRMRVTAEDAMRWQFKEVSSGKEIVTTLSVPTYRLQWKKQGVPRWNDMTTRIH